jgi:hypothetical protein
MTPCSPVEVHQRFRGNCRIKFSMPTSEPREQRTEWSASCRCLLGLLLDLEDWGSIFVRNIIELLPDYTVSFPSLYRVPKAPQFYPVLSHLNPVHTLTPCFIYQQTNGTNLSVNWTNNHVFVQVILCYYGTRSCNAEVHWNCCMRLGSVSHVDILCYLHE